MTSWVFRCQRVCKTHLTVLVQLDYYIAAKAETKLVNFYSLIHVYPCVFVCFALNPAVLTFEPQNAIILDYQATLAQFINNGGKPNEMPSTLNPLDSVGPRKRALLLCSRTVPVDSCASSRRSHVLVLIFFTHSKNILCVKC